MAKRILITLPPEHYRRLAELADADDRTAEQQARFLLRMALSGEKAIPRKVRA